MQMGSKPGFYIPLPLQQCCPQCSSKLNKNPTLALPQCSKKLNKNGCANRMASSRSHVSSSGSWCSFCIFHLSNGTIWNSSLVPLCGCLAYGLLQVLDYMHRYTPPNIFPVLENPSPQLGTYPMSLEI